MEHSNSTNNLKEIENLNKSYEDNSNFLNKKTLRIKDNNDGIYIRQKELKEKLLIDCYKDKDKDAKKIHYNIEAYSNPKHIRFLKDLIEDTFDNFGLDNIFCIYKSIDDNLNLIYSCLTSIISFDLINNKKINEIKNAHTENITNFRYQFDKKNQRDLIISVSSDDNNIKLWNITKCTCLLNINHINKKGQLLSACFLNHKNQIYILTSNKSFGDSEPIKVYDFLGNKIKEIRNSNYKTFILESYYDIKLNKNFIIAGNVGSIKSYDYSSNKIYHKYDNNKRPYISVIINVSGFENGAWCKPQNINKNKEIIKLIGSSYEGIIRIWNFHSGELLRRIASSANKIYGMCLWNNVYLFVGCYDKTIKLVDLKNGKIIKNLTGHTSDVLTIKKIKHPLYGECLISQSLSKDMLKIWVNKE